MQLRLLRIIFQLARDVPRGCFYTAERFVHARWLELLEQRFELGKTHNTEESLAQLQILTKSAKDIAR